MTMWELDYLLRNEAAGDVLVMGAGFSFAVDEAFPLTDRLGQLAVVASSLDMPRRRERGIYQMSLSDLGALIPENQPNFVGGTFETWMSYLAEPQPFLAPVERAQNHAQFLGFVRSIWEVLTLVEKEASRRGLPPWLYRLLSALHARQATVVTFNYDRLLEAGIEQLELQDFGQKPSDARVLWHTPLDGIPAPPPMAGLPDDERVDTFRLCKLHGSLNWYWVPGDPTGQTLNRWVHMDQTSEVFRRMPGHEPFVVPPTSSKSSFFTSPALSETWRRAHDALELATSVAFVGYSLPLTDLTAAGMFSKTLSDRDVSITVVNPSPTPIQESLQKLTGRLGSEVGSASDYADVYVSNASADLANRVRYSDPPDDTRLLVGWNDELLAKVLAIRREAGRVVLRVAECDGWPTHVVQGEDGLDESRMARRFVDLKAALREGDQLAAEFPNGAQSPLVGIDGFEQSTGASRYWQVLQPADRAACIGVRYEQHIGIPR